MPIITTNAEMILGFSSIYLNAVVTFFAVTFAMHIYLVIYLPLNTITYTYLHRNLKSGLEYVTLNFN